MTHVIKSERVLHTSGPPISRSKRSGEGPHEKSVRLVRLDGDVRALELTCSCGEVTLIELTYPDDSAAADVPERADAPAEPRP
jgi:hypothetical protein